jgi:putative flippase GtrA
MVNCLPSSIRSLVTWSTMRYAISGAIVGLFSLGMPILLNAELGVPLEVCIPIIYVLAAMLQFTFQRVFVFRHVERFALPMHRQALWYVVIVAVQYPVSALSTAFLPSLLGVPARAVFVVATLAVALLVFLFLRKNVFHAHDELEVVVDAADQRLVGEDRVAREREARSALLR